MDDPIRDLIVEDDAAQAKLYIERLYISGGFTIHWMANLAALWSYLEKDKPDILLLDYRLPEGTGIQMLEELPRRGSDLPVIIITSQGDERVAAQAIQHGTMEYLIKGTDFISNPASPGAKNPAGCGNGIALSLCQKIVRQYNGTITTIHASDKSTSLHIVLPLEVKL